MWRCKLKLTSSRSQTKHNAASGGPKGRWFGEEQDRLRVRERDLWLPALWIQGGWPGLAPDYRNKARPTAVPARTHTTKTTRKHRAGSTETGGCHNTKVDAAMKPSRIVGRLCYNGVGEVHITFIMQQIVCNDGGNHALPGLNNAPVLLEMRWRCTRLANCGGYCIIISLGVHKCLETGLIWKIQQNVVCTQAVSS